MMIQVVLILALAVLLVYAISQRSKAPGPALAMIVGAIVGVALVLFPETTTMIAEWLGVGRGADLVLYLFVLMTLAAIFNLHLRNRATAVRLTELARAIALMSAKKPEKPS